MSSKILRGDSRLISAIDTDAFNYIASIARRRGSFGFRLIKLSPAGGGAHNTGSAGQNLPLRIRFI